MVTGQAIDQDGGLWFVINGKGQQSQHRSRSPARTRTATPPADAAAGRGPSLRERPIRSPRCRRRVTIASTRDAVMLQCQITFPIGIVEIRLEQAHGMAATRPAGELEPGASRGVIRSESKHSPGRVITLVGVVSKLRTAERISRASNGFTLPYVSPEIRSVESSGQPHQRDRWGWFAYWTCGTSRRPRAGPGKVSPAGDSDPPKEGKVAHSSLPPGARGEGTVARRGDSGRIATMSPRRHLQRHPDDRRATQ